MSQQAMTEQDELRELEELEELERLEAMEKASMGQQAAPAMAQPAPVDPAHGETYSPDAPPPELMEPVDSVQDKSTGGSLKNRFLIGLANDEDQKLERGKALYGDSFRAEKDGNFSFIDPETKVRTLFNPEGLDIGDVAGVGREIIGGLGGIGGAFLGGLPGSAAGATAAAQAADWLGEKWAEGEAADAGREAPKGNEERLKEAGGEFLADLVGGGLLGMAGKALSPVKKELYEAYQRAKMPIRSLAAVSSSPAVHMTENALGDTFVGGRFIRQAGEQASKDLGDALDTIAFNMGGGRALNNVEDLGDFIKIAAAKSKEGFKKEASQRYGDLASKYGTSSATLNHTKAAIDEMVKDLPPDQEQVARAALEGYLKAELAAANKGQMNIKGLGRLRTRLFDDKKKEGLFNNTNLQGGEVKRLLQAATDDIDEAYTAISPAAKKEWADTQQWYKTQKGHRKLVDSKISGGENSTSRQIGNRALNPNTLDRDTLYALKQVLPEREYNTLRAGITRQLGRPLASSQMPEGSVSASRFAKETGSGKGAYSKDVQDMLWGNELDDLKTIAQGMTGAGRYYNTSRTAPTTHALSWLDRITQMLPKILMGGEAFARGGLPIYSGGTTLGLSLAHTSPALIRALAATSNPAIARILQGLGMAGGYGFNAARQ